MSLAEQSTQSPLGVLYSGSCVRSAPTARIITAHIKGQAMCTVVPEFKIRKSNNVQH